jgi:hypothetical protein
MSRMMRGSFGHFSRVILVVALGLAMAAVGFGHRDIAREAGRGLDPDYRAYLAAGGSAGDLCDHAAHESEPEQEHRHDRAGTGCEACRLVASVLLPAQAALPEPWDAPRSAAIRPGTGWHLARANPHDRPRPRAPPQA